MSFRIASAWVDVEYRIDAAEEKLQRAFSDKKQTVKVDADSTPFERKLAALSAQKVKVDADTASAEAKLTKLASSAESKIAAINAKSIKIDADTAAAEAKLAKLRNERLIGPLSETQQLKFDADVASAEAKIAGLRVQAQSIKDARVQVDADTATAETRLAAVRVKADDLARRRAQVQVDADTAGATTKLSAVQAETSALDGRRATVNVDADVGAALAKIALVTAAIGALGVGAVAGLGAVGAIGAAVAGGVGALGASLGGVGGAVKNLGKETAGAGGAASQSASNHLALASAIDRVKMAQAALANTTANTAASIRRADESIVSAKRDLERAYTDAARSAQDASASVADAEQRLAATQRDAQFAQEDLTRAREDAARAAADLTERVSDLALSERDANLSVLEAKQRLDQVNADGRSTDLQKQRAQLQYDQALERVNDVGDAQAEAAKEKAKLDAEGIDGSDQVQAALRRVEDANAAVADAQEGVAKARQDQADAAVAAQDRIADATKRVADAELAASEARRQAEYQLMQAKQAVIEAQRGVQQASQAAASGGGGGGGAPNPLAGLTPAAAAFAVFLRGFLDGPVAELRRVGSENLLPGLQRGLEGLTPILRTQITPAFGEFSRVMGGAFASAIPALGQFMAPLLRLGTGVLQGLAPLGPIFAAFTAQFSAMVDRISDNGTLQAGMAGFAAVIGAVLNVLPGLIEGGLRLMAVIGPPLAQLFEALVPLIVAVAQALGPGLGAVFQAIIPWIQQATVWIREHPDLFARVAAAAVALAVGFAGVMQALHGFSTVLQIVRGIMMVNPATLWIAGILAVGAALVYAYQHSEAFRGAVQQVWERLQAAGSLILATVKPALDALWQTIQTQVLPALEGFAVAIAPIISWLVDQLAPIVARVFSGIIDVIRGALTIVSGVINVITGLIRGDWSKVWEGIKQILSGAWTVMKATVTTLFGGIYSFLQTKMAEVKAFWGNAWTSVKTTVSTAMTNALTSVKTTGASMLAWFKGLPASIKSALGNLGGLLRDAGMNVINGFWNGLKEKWESVKQWFGSVTSQIPNLKGPEDVDRALLNSAGDNVMGGFEEAARARWEGSGRPFFQGVTAELAAGAVRAPQATAAGPVAAIPQQRAEAVTREFSFTYAPQMSTASHSEAMQFARIVRDWIVKVEAGER